MRKFNFFSLLSIIFFAIFIFKFDKFAETKKHRIFSKALLTDYVLNQLRHF